ncbi:MAG: hypothetical protein IT270_14095 [Saprospiraceae bacterium]|nr:hypothetical protein [Saprospiraceae bacterium]
MENYLTQLLSDIRAAQRPEVTTFQHESQSLEEHFAEVEAWIAGELEDEHVFGWHCGLESVQFPPAEQLTGEQMHDLVHALDRLLFSYNITTDLPEGLPIAKAYQLLVGVLDRHVAIVTSGFVGIEFCDYEPESCPFGEGLCQCLESERDFNEWKRLQDGLT